MMLIHVMDTHTVGNPSPGHKGGLSLKNVFVPIVSRMLVVFGLGHFFWESFVIFEFIRRHAHGPWMYRYAMPLASTASILNSTGSTVNYVVHLKMMIIVIIKLS